MRRRRPRGPAAEPVPAYPGTRAEPLLSAIALLAPLAIWAEISLVGRLFISELILIGALPFLLLARGRMLAAPLPRTFMLLLFAWLLAQIFSDMVNETPFVDYSRGWSKIVFTATNFMAIYLLVYGDRRRLLLFAGGLAFGGYLSYLLNPSEFAIAQPWKFGVGVATTMLFAVVVAWRPGVHALPLPALGFTALGAIGFYVGARSLAGVSIVAALYILLQQVLARRGIRSTRFSPMRSLMLLFFGLAVTSAALNLYGMAASQGILGEFAREKFERQSSGVFGVLLGGRAEIFVSTRAIADSPLIGHGSWAKDPQYSVFLLELEELGYEVNYLAAESELIPTHSHLFGAWVEAGVVGALFWLWVLFLAFRVLSNLFLVREPVSPLIVFLGFMIIWDILFSPFGAERRIIDPYVVVLLMFAWETLRASVPEEMLMRFRKLVPLRRRAMRKRTS
jgi:hypothetical protein